MKISKDSRDTARRLMQLCMKDGVLQEDRVHYIAGRMAADQPRHYAQILTAWTRLIRIELERRQVTATSAIELTADEKRDIENSLQIQYGNGLQYQWEVDPSMIAGIRLKVGDDVIDGTVKARIDRLVQGLETSAK
jgi:F-type H+-transporting ATPase subunit delta